MSREELDRLGARYDGVEVLHVDPGPEPGSRWRSGPSARSA
jgi:ubiquinol-cytochrome c reductase iron-sulfur subunit